MRAHPTRMPRLATATVLTHAIIMQMATAIIMQMPMTTATVTAMDVVIDNTRADFEPTQDTHATAPAMNSANTIAMTMYFTTAMYGASTTANRCDPESRAKTRPCAPSAAANGGAVCLGSA